MPNHYTTVCVVSGPETAVQAFRSAHILPDKEGDPFFDLGSVIPKPACVDATESGGQADTGFFALTGMHRVSFAFAQQLPWNHYVNRGFKLHAMSTPEEFLGWLEANEPDTVEKGRKQLTCFRETGYPSWYEWSYANWGTKWNSYNYAERTAEPGRFVFKFETAWSVPEPVFAKLVELHPSLVFDLVSIDEGGPQYEGRFCVDVQALSEVPESRDRHIMVYGRAPDEDEEE